jgi:hypothetical protein
VFTTLTPPSCSRPSGATSNQVCSPHRIHTSPLPSQCSLTQQLYLTFRRSDRRGRTSTEACPWAEEGNRPGAEQHGQPEGTARMHLHSLLSCAHAYICMMILRWRRVFGPGNQPCTLQSVPRTSTRCAIVTNPNDHPLLVILAPCCFQPKSLTSHLDYLPLAASRLVIAARSQVPSGSRLLPPRTFSHASDAHRIA